MVLDIRTGYEKLFSIGTGLDQVFLVQKRKNIQNDRMIHQIAINMYINWLQKYQTAINYIKYELQGI
jgi:hypothetical protein